MSRRSTRCIPLMPTSPAPPPTDWHTYCGRIIDEDQAQWPESWPESWPECGQNRPAGVCHQCWPKYRAKFDAVRAVQLSPRPCRCVYVYVPRYDGPTFSTLRRPTDGVKP